MTAQAEHIAALEDRLAEHAPVLGVFAGNPGIVGCTCLSARDYRAAGHRAGQEGWRAHVAAALVEYDEDTLAAENTRLRTKVNNLSTEVRQLRAMRDARVAWVPLVTFDTATTKETI